MRRYLVFFALCLIFFILPLHIFIIGDFIGIGIQGAVYRCNISGYGMFFFPITREIVFVLNGTYSGRTALSVLLWISGTVVLACTIIYAFLHVNDTIENYYRQVACGLIAACGIFLGSCMAQYGLFFHGPAGISFPISIITIPCWIIFLYYYWNISDKVQKIA